MVILGRLLPLATLLVGFLFAPADVMGQGIAPDPSLKAQAGSIEEETVEPVEPDPPGDPDDIDQENGGEDEDGAEHRGFFFRFALGLGWGWIGGEGTLPPSKGVVAVEDPAHNAPLFNLALSLGGGVFGFALHVGGVYEKMLLRADDPTEMGFTLMGVGGGLTYYFTDYDFFATAQVRFMGLMIFMKDVICDDYFADKFEWYRGPGVALTLGKEWFKEEKDKGVGLGLQFNFARLSHDNGVTIDYMSLLLMLTISKF